MKTNVEGPVSESAKSGKEFAKFEYFGFAVILLNSLK